MQRNLRSGRNSLNELLPMAFGERMLAQKSCQQCTVTEGLRTPGPLSGERASDVAGPSAFFR